jgi:hypothetical protein
MQQWSGRPWQQIAGLGICLTFILLAFWPERRGPEIVARTDSPVMIPSPPDSYEAAMREAKRCWGLAQTVIKPDLEILAAQNSYAPPGAEERWRRQLMSADRGGCLRKALLSVRRAEERANAPAERYEATVWYALIECDRGDHRTELQQAQQLVKLAPRNPTSWGTLHRAARCNGLSRLAWKAERVLQTLKPGSG